jgi:uncharacterized membrane protein YphA (DoxX/SURF4 family)
MPRALAGIDAQVTEWMARYGITITRLALGVVFFWFGVLKFAPGLSPAYDLAGRTIAALTLGWVSPEVSLPVLAAWECAIGLGLLFGRFLRLTLLLLFLQMPGTMVPVVLFPHEVFHQVPFVPTLEGQYIIKNLVLIGAALVVGATVRGGWMIADPARLPASRPLPASGDAR